MISVLSNTRLGRALTAAARALSTRSGTIEAGGGGPRWHRNAILRTPAREIAARSETAGARAAAAFLNSTYGAAIVSAWVTNVTMDGPSCRPKVSRKAARQKLTEAFARWWSQCDAEGRSDLGGFLARTVRSLVVNGEAFVHLESDPAAAALQLRLWNVNQVDRSMNRDLGVGFRVVAGIEFDPRGRRLAYHVRENPDAPFATTYGTIRVPAEDVLHIFEPLFPGQVRGLSWLAPALTRIAEIDKAEDANLARLNAASLFAGFLTKPSEGAPDVLPIAPNAPAIDLEPGAFIQVPPGYGVEFSQPPSSDGAVDFTRAMIRSAAAGAGVPYELVSGDLSQVNYSSARLGLSEFRQRVTAIRRTLIVPQLLDPIWRRWVALEVLAGRLKLDMAALPDAEWVWPGWPAVDPLKETNAEIQAISARIKSRFETIAARGRDPEEVDAEIAMDTAPAAARESSK